MMFSFRMNAYGIVCMMCLSVPSVAHAFQSELQSESLRFGMEVSPDVELITKNGLKYLAESQNASGTWEGGTVSHGTGSENCGVAGLAALAMMACGEDPNAGPYAKNIRASLRYLITNQNPETGYLPGSMYHHGFAMLALAEAYGTIDESLLWSDATQPVSAERKRTIGQALRLAVEMACRSQEQNPSHAWRYTPTSKDADTSVTGAILVGLLAARNAGVAVPDRNVDDALEYLSQLTSRRNGMTMYQSTFGGMGDGPNLSAITALVLSISQHRDSEKYEAAKKRIVLMVNHNEETHPHYNLYYMSQALFQTDFEAWSRWNEMTIRRLRRLQKPDGSFESTHGHAYATAMSCLALALNYRFLPIYER